MNQIARVVSGEVVKFDPNKTLDRQAKMDAVIEYAKTIKEWPLLEQAVDQKIDEQAEFVAWWRAVVTPNRGARTDLIAVLRLSLAQAEESTGISKQQVSRWAKALKNTEAYRARLFGKAWSAAFDAAENHRAQGTGDNEWYTPEKYVELARGVLGTIDLDPASNDMAQKTVRAVNYYTRETDGLAHEWAGRVWMNPPYAQPLIYQFIQKLVDECAAGRVEQAIVLTHNSTDTLWFHRLEEIASRICFTRGRIAFTHNQGEQCSPTQGQAFFYVGDNTYDFDEIFSAVGFVR